MIGRGGAPPNEGLQQTRSAFASIAAALAAEPWCSPDSHFVDGLQSIRFPSWLPSKLLGFRLVPRWASSPLNVLAFTGRTTRQGAELKTLQDGPIVINVCPAGDPDCWADCAVW